MSCATKVRRSGGGIARRGLTARLSRVRHVVMDMDGTIYCGGRLFETTIPFLKTLESLGISYSFLTNNSSKSAADYVGKLSSMGVRIDRGQLCSSTLFAADHMRRNFPQVRKLFVLGTESMKLELCAGGYEIVNTMPDAVVVGYDTELSYDKLCRAAYWLSEGALFVSTHPDRYCPTNVPEFMAIDCGWMTEFLERVSGRKSLVLGKPSTEILEYATRRHGVSPQETAMAGDRYDTDIRMAISAGAFSVHVSVSRPSHSLAPDMTVPDLSVFGQALKEANQ